jgi:hypothetical protein
MTGGMTLGARRAVVLAVATGLLACGDDEAAQQRLGALVIGS